jgi:hypothetical protein
MVAKAPHQTMVITANTIEITNPAIARPLPPWLGSFPVWLIPIMLKTRPSGQQSKLHTNPVIAIPLVFGAPVPLI